MIPKIGDLVFLYDTEGKCLVTTAGNYGDTVNALGRHLGIIVSTTEKSYDKHYQVVWFDIFDSPTGYTYSTYDICRYHLFYHILRKGLKMEKKDEDW